MRSPWNGWRNYRTRRGGQWPATATETGYRTDLTQSSERPMTEDTESFSFGLSLRILDLELRDGTSAPGGVDVLGIKSEQSIQRRCGESFPVQASVNGNIGTAGTDCEKRLAVRRNDPGAVAGRLLRGGLPRFRLVFGESGNARTHTWIRVVAANSGETSNARTRDRKNSRSGVIRCYRSRGRGPGFSAVAGVQNASGESSGDNKQFAFGDDQQIGIARGESAFLGQSRGKILRRQRIPAMTIGGLQQQETSVDGIAESKTICGRRAGDGIQEESIIQIGVLQFPVDAAVDGFVDLGFVAFAAGHERRGFVIESDDAAKIEFRLAGNGEASPRCAVVDRAKNYIVRSGGPNRDVACGGDFRRADAAQVGVNSRSQRDPGLCACAG